MNKRQELESLIYEDSRAIILVAESWAYGDVADGELVVEGYNIITKNSKGGGCLIMFKDEYNININQQLTDTQKRSGVN